MEKELKEKWVTALRSGEYKQGQRYLKQPWGDEGPKHCCLGVLCEVAGIEETEACCGDCGDVEYLGSQDDNALLGEELLEQFGMLHPDMIDLANKNDSGNYNFEKIADYIEEGADF